jgi:hypothetical protein
MADSPTDPPHPPDPTAAGDATPSDATTDQAAADGPGPADQVPHAPDHPRDPPAEAADGPGAADQVPGADHRDVPPVDDRSVPRRIFLAIGGFVLFMAVLYWFTSYEDAGSVLLALASALALWFGIYLWLQQRRAAQARARGDEADAALHEGAPYLPTASAWPFAIGLGAATIANGLVLGIWVIVPGALLFALGIGGFVHQTRHRL